MCSGDIRETRSAKGVSGDEARERSDHLWLYRPFVKNLVFILSEMGNLWRVSCEQVIGFNLGFKRITLAAILITD